MSFSEVLISNWQKIITFDNKKITSGNPLVILSTKKLPALLILKAKGLKAL
jgi:hypothetical protein